MGFFDVAKLLGREERARKVVSHLNAQARTNRNRLASAIASGSKLAVFAFRGSQLLSTGLGFAPSRLLNQLSFKNVAATNAPVFAPMSSKGLLMVKADRAMLLNFGAPKEIF